MYVVSYAQALLTGYLIPATKGWGAGTPDDIPCGSLSSLLSRGKREDPGNEVGLRS